MTTPRDLPSIHLDCVLVSVDYGDFLRYTLPLNVGHFDRTVVVTTPEDTETQRVCREYNVSCVLSRRMFAQGAAFNKGCALNDGIMELTPPDWVLITDADMVMPPDLRSTLERQALDPQFIYGTDRYLCPGYDQWLAYREDERVKCEWSRQGGQRCLGMGFFQLVNVGSRVLRGRDRWYSSRYPYAGRSRRFLRQWPPRRRARLEDVVPVHLASSGNEPMGVNWSGRVTARFGPSLSHVESDGINP